MSFKKYESINLINSIALHADNYHIRTLIFITAFFGGMSYIKRIIKSK